MNYYYGPTAPRMYSVALIKNANDDTRFIYLLGEDYNSLYDKN